MAKSYRNKILLNNLVEMQNSLLYATRKQVLIEAEKTIVDLEDKLEMVLKNLEDITEILRNNKDLNLSVLQIMVKSACTNSNIN